MKMNNREEWSQTERDMQDLLDGIRKEYPDFWAEEPKLPPNCHAAKQIRKEKQIRRHRRGLIIAACFAAILLCSSAMAVFINSDAAYAMKFALEKKYYEVKGMVMATDTEKVNEDNSIAITITDESKIEEGKKLWEDLMIPGSMIEGYEFEELTISKYINEITTAEYIYTSAEHKLVITISSPQNESNDIVWLSSPNVLNGEVPYYIWKDELSGSACMKVLLDKVSVSICGFIEDRELIDIMNGMK